MFKYHEFKMHFESNVASIITSFEIKGLRYEDG